MGTHPIFESDFDCLTAPERRGWNRIPVLWQHSQVGDSKTISEEDQGTYTAKVGAKKCECKVSISLFGDNNNNNANENNNNNNNNNNVASIRAAPVNLAREVRPEVKTHETISNNCASIVN